MTKKLATVVVAFYLVLTQPVLAFDAGEHALIGDTAFNQSARQIENKITNLEMDVSYSYGQLVALSGDMYRSVEEIALSDAKLFNGFFRRNRDSLKKCIDIEIAHIRNDKEYAGCDDMKMASKKLRYVTLAHDNFSHFAWHNLKQYIQRHEQALWFANLAHLKCTDEQKKTDKKGCKAKDKQVRDIVAKSDYVDKLDWQYRKMPDQFPRKKFSKRYFNNISKEKMWNLALFANAYADHFLSDAFSAGHLRVPRSQIDGFVESYGETQVSADGAKRRHQTREEGSAISGALTQFLHNSDGFEKGIKVSNSLGQQFVVRSDKQLFAMPNSVTMSNQVEQNQQLKQPVIAVSLSLKEVLAVYRQGQKAMPKAEFAGLLHVPFVQDNQANSLSGYIKQSVAAEGSIKNAVNSMSEEMQLVFKGQMMLEDLSYKQYFTDFINGIPKFMAELRTQIAAESQDPALSKRIPKPLLAALKKLN